MALASLFFFVSYILTKFGKFKKKWKLEIFNTVVKSGTPLPILYGQNSVETVADMSGYGRHGLYSLWTDYPLS